MGSGLANIVRRRAVLDNQWTYSFLKKEGCLGERNVLRIQRVGEPCG